MAKSPTGTAHEDERLNPGSSKIDTPQPVTPVSPSPEKNDAALPGSPNSDLRGPKRHRGPRGMSP